VIRNPSFEGANQSKEGDGTATKRPAMPSNYAQFHSRSHDAVIPVYDAASNMIETHEHKGEFKEL
jgi:hypothetical protein